MKRKIDFQMTQSLPQLMWLADSKYGKNRMAFLVSMLRMTALAGYESVVNNIPARVSVGQVERSEVQLAKDWQCDRKTVARVIETMNRLGIITTEKSNRTSVHCIHIVAAWVMDNVRIRNPHFKTDYDWRGLQSGCLADAVSGVTLGQPLEQTSKSGKVNVHSARFLDDSGRPMVMPTVNGLEVYENSATLDEPTAKPTSTLDSNLPTSETTETEANESVE